MGEEGRHYIREGIKNRADTQLLQKTNEELEHLREGLRQIITVADEDTIEDLILLGFTRETVGVLPLIPLVQMAWADGEVQGREAKSILGLTEDRGYEIESEAFRLIDSLLTKQPTVEYMQSCLFVLKEIYDRLPKEEEAKAKDHLLGYAQYVAQASGGILGLFGDKVSKEEKDLLAEFNDMMNRGSTAPAADTDAEDAPSEDAKETPSDT